jgi:hypothetical protein
MPSVSGPTLDDDDSPWTGSDDAVSGACRTTNGVYGSVDGTVERVVFAYELETLEVTQEQLVGFILPPLERDFNDYLLPTLFKAECGSAVRRFLTLDDNHRRLVEVVGISARPDDFPLAELNCSSFMMEGSSCSVIQGELSLFVLDDANRRALSETEANLVRATLKRGMDDNVFADTQKKIVRVSYVDLLYVDPGAQQGNEQSTGNDGLQASAILGIVAAAGTMFLLIGIIVAYRRRKQREASFISLDETPGSQADSTSGERVPSGPIKEEDEDEDSENGIAPSDAESVYLETKPADGRLAVHTSSTFGDAPPDVADLVSPTDSSIYLDNEELLVLQEKPTSPVRNFL